MMIYLIWMIKGSKNSFMIFILRNWISVVFKVIGDCLSFFLSLFVSRRDRKLKYKISELCSVIGVSERRGWVWRWF